MRRIYEQCMQVIVYLGPDLATSNVASRYRLHELETHFGSLALTLPISLHDILKRKYFSRIWVIQELVLSQRALFRIKHYEFWADSRTAHCLPPSWSWDSTEARWVQFMATKTLPVKNILELLQLASQSHASDPRDKLFGLLGLYQGDASAQALPPDYSLSVQNVFLGFFAYCLVNLKHVDLLYRAAGLGAPKSSPSWVPNWEADWPHIFTTPAVDSDEMAGRITQHIGCSKLGILQPDSKAPRWARSLIFRDQPQSPEWAEALFHRRPWFHDASIHANTGALRVYLTHFCAISRRPSLVDTIGSSCLFEVLGNSSRLFLASETNLESTVDPTDDHLFILNTGNSKLIYLILRPLAYPRTYKMIAACTHLFIHFHGGITPFRSLSISSVAVGISVIRSGLNISMADLTGMNMYFPSAETGWDTLSAYWGMLMDSGIYVLQSLDRGYQVADSAIGCLECDAGVVQIGDDGA
ncbi:predicted protein [Aspergillus terreus NIH2624]|uniref:Heterokaryon incompatibility domain-containing protein n=1 Tax=Aspergillus terreus (strain NIH 2624 / FGSC A1156) TaxID=341663 RepID=Q0C7Z2_ASPTN|nr:uncharacterized protein ATEG_10192 [Aspergillus terreus NIH2624]EAU29641.1 predicted protein [Aspergillus terreus NIH2624]